MAEGSGGTELPAWVQYAANACLFVIMVLAGLFGLLKKKNEKSEEGLDLHVLGVEDVTSNRVVRRFIELLQEEIETNKRVAIALEGMAKTTLEREKERRTKEEVDRLVDDELRRRGEPARRHHDDDERHHTGAREAD